MPASSSSEPMPPNALGDLVALHTDGQLVSRYPEVRRLLADMSGPELLRAGQLLARLAPDDILGSHPGTNVVSVAVTGHGALSAIGPVLAAELARHGLVLRLHMAEFDSFVFDLSDPGSALYAADAELVLCVLDAMTIFDEVPLPWRVSDVENTLAEKLRVIDRLVATFDAASRGTLVLNTIPLPRRFSAQLIDHRSQSLLGAAWREANARLLRLALEHPKVVVIDLDPILADGTAAEDVRLSVYAKAHLSPDLLARYAREVGHLARNLTGLGKKCAVLDLDGTVWGGVLGEDGPDGIEVADSFRGEAFRAFQKVVKQITSQGVLLAAVSKNDPEPVRAVLSQHPRMTLHEDDFVHVTANWRPKHENITELAGVLNLSVDSFVFMDDSPYECGLVHRELPTVSVVRADAEPALHVEKLLRDNWFGVLELTEEDRARSSQYRDEVARKNFLENFDSLDDYLRELDVQVQLSAAAEPEVSRISQLTLRTNQFNLTTRRLQPADVHELINDPSWGVYAIHSRDRFGDNGLVGAIFTRHAGSAVHVDNFLLSCRVFSRGIEQACLAVILSYARRKEASEVFGTYRPTAKNAGVRDFYPRYGFTQIADDGQTVTFRHCLAEVIEPPAHVKLTQNLEVNSA
jgi:FkbH-like protein